MRVWGVRTPFWVALLLALVGLIVTVTIVEGPPLIDWWKTVLGIQ